MIEDIVGAFQKLWELLPKDPFREYIEEVATYFDTQEWIGILNYFVPLGAFVKIGSAWLVAVAAYLVYCRIRAALFGGKG